MSCGLCRATCTDAAEGDPRRLAVCKSIFDKLSAGTYSKDDVDREMTATFGKDWMKRSVGAILFDRMGSLDLGKTVKKVT